MRVNYDLHIHSCLSPCGDNDMTPYNLANMAKIMGLDVIALTDHNTAMNCRSTIKAGEKIGLKVIPGMELCTMEEVHVVCLFPDVDNAEEFSRFVRNNIPPVKNRKEIFGEQLIFDECDNILGEEELLLTTACNIGIEKVSVTVKEYGGYCFPAHIDRSSYSVISNLGSITPEMNFNVCEITKDGDREKYKSDFPIINGMKILSNSDAHYLENIGNAGDFMEIDEDKFNNITSFLEFIFLK